MQTYLKEKIGNPELFTGRKRELTFYLNWIERIKQESSLSSAILSRRKTGKTALLQRLYNLTFDKNMGVIPFYYEVREGKQWVVNFCKEFYLTFLYQYIAFKTRKPNYLTISQKEQESFAFAIQLAQREGLEYLVDDLEGVEMAVNRKSSDTLWNMVRDAPRLLATRRNESIVQIIDAFQYLNSEIYWDEAKTNQADDLASGYMQTAEYKNAPLLVSGSWVGWLFNLLNRMTGRFQMDFLEPLPEDEAVEMVFKYALLEDIPVTEATAYLIAQSCEGNPAYISSLMRSRYPEKDLTTEESVLHTLEFETLDERGAIKRTWLEYLYSALPRINERYAKQIILYLCKHKDQKVSRRELIKNLNLEMAEEELADKMEAFIRADIINRGGSSVRYQAVQDNIFDKVFRGEFGGDIEEFDERDITNEYKALFEETRKKYRQLLGRYSQEKGAFAEYQILKKLRTAYCHNDLFCSMIQNLPQGFHFVEYENVWSYYGTAQGRPDFQVDIFAFAPDGTSIIGEIKNRGRDPFSKSEAEAFLEKMETLKEMEHVTDAIGFVFSRSGFSQQALTMLQEQQIAYSDDDHWLE
jgi:hypothetical protein